LITVFNMWMHRTQWSLFHVLSFCSRHISPVSPASGRLGNWWSITVLRVTYDRLFRTFMQFRIRLRERESGTVIDDWRRLLPAEWATEQAEQKHQWELDVCGQCECIRQHVLSRPVKICTIASKSKLRSGNSAPRRSCLPCPYRTKSEAAKSGEQGDVGRSSCHFRPRRSKRFVPSTGAGHRHGRSAFDRMPRLGSCPILPMLITVLLCNEWRWICTFCREH
jgi:hypothetical protein